MYYHCLALVTAVAIVSAAAWTVPRDDRCVTAGEEPPAETIELNGDNVEVVEELGPAVLLCAKTEGIPTATDKHTRRAGVNYEWYMVQDSGLGVVFHEPSGVKHNRAQRSYDGDIDLRALTTVQAVEVRALTFDVWRQFTGTLSATKIDNVSEGETFDLDPRRRFADRAPHKHFVSIMYVARVLYPDGTIVHADTDLVLKAARRLSEKIKLEDLAPDEGVNAEEFDERKAE